MDFDDSWAGRIVIVPFSLVEFSYYCRKILGVIFFTDFLTFFWLFNIFLNIFMSIFRPRLNLNELVKKSNLEATFYRDKQIQGSVFDAFFYEDLWFPSIICVEIHFYFYKTTFIGMGIFHNWPKYWLSSFADWINCQRYTLATYLLYFKVCKKKV